jgi:hypothetical protein
MSNELPIEQPPVTPVAEPVALAVEPETLPTVFAEPEPEENRAIHGSTMKAEAPAAEAEGSAAAKTKGKNSRSDSQLAAGSEVLLSKIVFESKFAKNSGSVKTVQTRLIELGYTSAGDDRQGWISDGTANALAEFVADSKIEAHSIYAEVVINALFVGTGVVVLP